MVALSKAELAKQEEEHGLSEDDLTYAQRLSRITAVKKGEEWTAPKPKIKRNTEPERLSPQDAARKHNLWGKKILLTPLMAPDKQRNLAYDERVGHEIEVREASAGEMIYGQPEDVDRMVGDYVVVRENKDKPVYAKTTFPKIGTEISWIIGQQICPVVRGNDGQQGYIWSYPTSLLQIKDTVVQVYGLKTLITLIYPELLTKFSGKPVMSYIDGVTLAASIPQTEAILKEASRQEKIDARAGLI
jgi:hypothetical protein